MSSSQSKSTPRYAPTEVETKWQTHWAENQLDESNVDRSRPKHYALTMLPYPSGDLHIGHWYAMAPSDARARFMRMQGHNVLFPMGFDGFGLPAENAAIRHKIHPKEWTFANIDRMRGQLKRMGMMIDWRRDTASCNEEYYRWTEWYFLQLLKHGHAYRKMSPVDWCPSCNTTLAREQVWGDDRRCERCQTKVIKKDLEQWFFKTTDYADELLDFSGIDWPDKVRTLQTNWIGRSKGADVVFKTVPPEGGQSRGSGDELEVFTTRPDTLWGATFMVLAPEHPLVGKLTTADQKPAVDAYIEQAQRQSDIQREAADKEKSGVFTGGYAINPVNDERVPIWIADYVLMSYGTGAIMAVPAHDQRDFEFARKYDLEVRPVIQPEGSEPLDGGTMETAAVEPGTMINSGPLTGTATGDSVARVIEHLEERGTGRGAVSYRLRDWLISRQRYWGCPIPVIYCDTCGIVPVPDADLPVLLPEDVEWQPTGESPLKLHPTWKQVSCPGCGGEAERETDTMDTFMCSSWYHLRYLSPHYAEGPFDPEEADYWMPVDTYTGGIEHATMHLIYTRFFHKAGRDMGIVEGDEPMLQLRNQGIILGEDSEKMSKSRGNVVAPDSLVDHYGSDTVRAFLMFFARWEQGGPWNSRGIEGAARWIKRAWSLFTSEAEDGAGGAGSSSEPARTVSLGGVGPGSSAAGGGTWGGERALRRKVHQTVRQVTSDFERFQFNTLIAALMELLNEMYQARTDGAVGTDAWREAQDIYLRLLAPVAPHIAEELWQRLGKPYSVHEQSWPELDEEAAKVDSITLIVQVNGKLRDRIEVEAGIDDDKAKELALSSEGAQKFTDGKEIKKVIVVKGRLVNIVAI